MNKKEYDDNTFVKITNRDIYDKLVDIEKTVILTNGKVKWHTKLIAIIGSALVTFILFIANKIF